jgi:hypothetical protein
MFRAWAVIVLQSCAVQQKISLPRTASGHIRSRRFIGVVSAMLQKAAAPASDHCGGWGRGRPGGVRAPVSALESRIGLKA